MPEADREWLNQELSKRNFSGYQELADLLQERGFEISHAAVHRHGQKLERRLQAIKTSTEAARLIADAAPDRADHRSAAVMSMIQTSLFNALVDLQEAEEKTELDQKMKLLNGAAISFSMLAKASLAQKKWADDIATKLDALAKENGKKGEPWITPEQVERIKKVVYGL